MDRLSAFLGKPIEFNGAKIYSPSIEEIGEIGEMPYRLHLTLATFDKEKILVNLLGISDEEYEEIENQDSFEILTGYSLIVDSICEGISFFTKETIRFNYDRNEFYFQKEEQDISLLNKENYQSFSLLLNNLNGIEPETKLEFKNDRVKQKYKKTMKQRKQVVKGDDFELKDTLSILCNADGNGINIFNIGKLTIYQVYEHFERINVKENHKRMLALWANTFSLKEGTKLPEWIVRTKF